MFVNRRTRTAKNETMTGGVRLTFRRPAKRLYRATAAFVAFLMLVQTFFAGTGFAATATVIVPDGNTETWLESSGSVTDVHTDTVIGGRTGINSFRVFDVGEDSTVNLHLPTGTSNLINLVHDRRSFIDGTLNSVMNGAIGGNVYFLNPYGTVVGPEGTINVGSLTLMTPEEDFMRGFFSRQGEPNPEAVSQVLEGLVPVSREGLISVRGQVNAIRGVDVAAGTVEIGDTGVVSTGAVFVAQEPDFSEVINMGGLSGAARTEEESSRIRVVAVEDVIHAGVISADGGVLGEGGASVHGGDVLVRAGRDIVLQDGSLISARGRGADSDGGEIVVFADREAVFIRGAAIDARGGDVSGDGGFIELSALDTVRLEGGAFRAWATDGRAGKVLIDPEDLVVSSDQFLNGADYNLEASRSITIEGGVTISTRRVQGGGDHGSASSTGDSGDITLEAPEISVGRGARLLAHADGEFAAGDIRLVATSASVINLAPSIHHTSIVIDGATLRGRNISLIARSTAKHEWDPRGTLVGTLESVAPDLLDDLARHAGDAVYDQVYAQIKQLWEEFGLVNIGLAVADAQATVKIGADSQLLASGDVELRAESTAVARSIVDNPNDAGLVGVVLGVMASHADVRIEDGASIRADNLNLSATNVGTLDLHTIAVGSPDVPDVPLAVGFAAGVGVVGSSAVVERGADIHVSGDLSLAARNQSSFGVIAQAQGGEGAAVGSTGSLLVAYTDARASLDADVQAPGGGRIGNVAVHAIDVIERSEVAADTVPAESDEGDESGDGSGDEGDDPSSTALDFLLGKLREFASGSGSNDGSGSDDSGPSSGFSPDERSGMDKQEASDLAFKLSGAVAIGVAGHNASATIGDDVTLPAGGDVSVVALVKDEGQQARAVSKLAARVEEQGQDGQDRSFSTTGALVFGWFWHDAEASIGKNVDLTARNLGVRADVVRTAPTSFDWSGVGDVAEKLKGGENVTEGLLGGYAASGGPDGSDLSLSGAILFLHYESSATASVGSGAHIRLVEEGGEWTSEVAAVHGDDPGEAGEAYEIEWDSQVSVGAGTTTRSAFGGGDALTGMPQDEGEGDENGDAGDGGDSGGDGKDDGESGDPGQGGNQGGNDQGGNDQSGNNNQGGGTDQGGSGGGQGGQGSGQGSQGGGQASGQSSQGGGQGGGQGSGEGGAGEEGESSRSASLSGTYAQVDDNNETIAFIGDSVTIERADAATDKAVDVSVTAEADRGILLTAAGAGGGESFGLNGNFGLSVVRGTTQAYVDGSANLDVGGDVRIDAHQNTVSILAAGGVERPSGANLSATLGIQVVDTVTKAFVKEDASGSPGAITANDISVTARSGHTVEAETWETGNSAAVTFTYFDSLTDALLGGQPTYNVAGDVVVGALNENSFSLSAGVEAQDGAVAGIAAAILAVGQSETKARSNADLIGISNLYITAVERIEQTAVSASTSVSSKPADQGDGTGEGSGNGGAGGGDDNGNSGSDQDDDGSGSGGNNGSGSDSQDRQTSGTRAAAENLVGDHLKNNAPESKDQDTEFKMPTIGGAVSFVHASHGAEATVGEDSEIDASGSVAVVARTEQSTLQQKAETAVVSQGLSDGQSGVPLTVSGAVVVGVYSHRADARIGAGSDIAAQNVGVRSEVVRDYPTTWHKWEGVSSITSKLKEELGLVDGYLSAYANAKDSPGKDEVGLSGSVVVMNFHNDSTAVVDEGATISIRPGSAGTWESALLGIDEDESVSWDAAVSVQALTDLTGAYAAGDIDIALNRNRGQQASASVGGSYAQVNYFVTTRATLAKNVVIGATGGGPAPDVSLGALTKERSFVIVPSAGGGATYGVVGNAGLTWLESDTIASIEDGDVDANGDARTRIDAGALKLAAEQELLSFVVAGAVTAGENVGVGVGIGVQNVQTNTGVSVGRSLITARSASIEARTDGIVETIAVAGSAATSGSQNNGVKNTGSGAGALDRAKNAVGNAEKLAGNLGEKGSSLSPEKVKESGEALEESDDEDKSDDRPSGLRPGEDDDKSGGSDDNDSDDNDNNENNDDNDGNDGNDDNDSGGVSGASAGGSGGAGTGSGGGGTGSGGARFGLGVSGSVALNVVSLNTSATIHNAVIQLGGDTESDLSVTAVNNTNVGAFSGAASLVRANNQSSRFSAGVAGSLAANVMTNSTEATVVGSTVRDAHEVAVHALSGGDQLAIALGMALNASSQQGNGGTAAGSASVSVAANTVRASVDNSTLLGLSDADSRGGVEVLTYDRTRMATGGGSLMAGGKGGLGLAVTYTGIHNRSEAVISNTEVSQFDDVDVTALNAAMIAAGGAMGGLQTERQGASLGGAFVVSAITNTTSARIESGSRLSDVGDVAVSARDVSAFTGFTQRLDEIVDARACTGDCDEEEFDIDYSGEAARTDGYMEAGAEQAGQDTAAAGDDATDEADAETAKEDDAAGIERRASDDRRPDYSSPDPYDDGYRPDYMGGSSIVSVAGTVQAGTNNLGISLAWNTIANTFEAKISDSDVSADGDVDVVALSNTTIIGASVGAGAGDRFSGAGSVSVNHTLNRVVAEISSSDAGRKVAGEQVAVRAIDGSDISSLAGGVGFAGGGQTGAAAGLAIAFSGINNTTRAAIDGIDVETNGVARVDARNESTIRTLALAGAATSGTAAIAGSVALSEIGNTTEAEVVSTRNNELNVGSLIVTAREDAQINALAGQVSLAGKAAVGGAAAVNWIGNTVRARIAGSVVNADKGAGDENVVSVESENASRIRTLAASGGAANNVAVGGSAVVSVIFNKTEAEIAPSGATAVETDRLSVRASDDSRIYALGGQLSASGTAAVGGAVVLSHIFNTTRAAAGAPVTASELAFIHAENKARIYSAAASGGASQSAAVSGSFTFSFIGNRTESVLTGAGGTDGVKAGQLVVAAEDGSVIGGLTGALSAASSAAVGGAVGSSNIVNTVRAAIEDVDVEAADAVTVHAANKARIISAALAGQAGQVAVGGSATANVIVNKTLAEIVSSTGQNRLVSDGTLNVFAEDDSAIYTMAGSVAGGGNASVGFGATVNNISNTTKAVVDSVDVEGESDALIAARNTSRIVGLGVSGQGAGQVGAGATLMTNNIANNTVAEVLSKHGNVYRGKHMAVSSQDRSEIYALAVQLAAGGNASVGAATAVNNITNYNAALVRDTAVELSGSAEIDAASDSIIIGASVHGGAGGNAAAGGSVITSFINNDTVAEASGSVPLRVGSLAVKAADRSQIHSVAGQVSGGGNASIGAALSVSEIGNLALARIAGAQVIATGTVGVDASNESVIGTGAASAGGAGNASVRGSDTTNIILNETIAEVCAIGRCDGDASQPGPDVVEISADEVVVRAADRSTINSLAGQVGGAANAAVGGALAHNQVANRAVASASAAVLNVTQKASVEAENASTIRTLAISGGGSGVGASVQGSIASSHINNVTEARLVDSEVTGRSAKVSVLATDQASISSLSGAVAANLGAGAGVGVAVSVNQIGNTTSARVSGSRTGSMYDVGNLLVASRGKANIESIAASARFAGAGAGVGGSTAINLINNDTVATINEGARVLAQDNVGVLAWSDDKITNIAGGVSLAGLGAGVGATATVSQLGGKTVASIEGDDTSVTALARGDAMEVASGDLNKSLDLESLTDIGDSLENFNPLQDLSSYRRTESVRGVAVNASATRHIQNFGGNASVAGFAGVGGITNASVLTGSTEAFVKGASINELTDGGPADAAQSVHINAGDHALAHGLVLSGAAGIAGVGAAVNTTVFAQTTRAFIENTGSVSARDAVRVRADSTQHAATAAAGASVGKVGVAGAVNVGVFTGVTEAFVRNSAVESRELSIEGLHASRLFVAGGAVAGGVAAAGGAFAVNVDQSTTRAFMEDSEADVADNMSVHAESDTELYSLAASGGGGPVSVAGSAILNVVKNTTTSYVAGSRIGSEGDRSGSASVTAVDRVTAGNLAGTAGVSVAGAGAAAAVTYVGNSTGAYVSGGTLYSSGTVKIGSEAERRLSTIAGSAGYGGARLSAVVAVTLVGALLSDQDLMGELDADGQGTLSAMNGLTTGDRLVLEGEGRNIEIAQGVTDPDDPDKPIQPVTQDDLASVNETGRVDVKDLIVSGAPGSTTAEVNGNATIDALGDIVVDAQVRDSAQVIAGGAGAGGVVSAGAAIGVLHVANRVDASVLGGSSLRAGGGIAIHGSVDRNQNNDLIDDVCGSDYSASVCAFQGGAAGGAALGAAVALNTNDNIVTARVGHGANLSTTGDGDVQVVARDLASVYADARGYSLSGAAAAGAVLATARKSGTAAALIGSATSADKATTVTLSGGGLSVTSERSGRVTAVTTAGSGALGGALSVSTATAKDDGDSRAVIGFGVSVKAPSGLVSVGAVSRPRVEAEARGYGGSLAVSVGASAAIAEAEATTEARIESNTDIEALALEVIGRMGLLNDQPTTRSFAEAIGGSLGGSINAATSKAVTRSTVVSFVGADVTIGAGAVVRAVNTTMQRADVTGVTGSFFAAGAAPSEANSYSTTRAELAGDQVIAGALAVRAEGSDDNDARATAGSGGVVSGAAAVGKTTSESVTEAEIDGGVVVDGGFALYAGHTTKFSSKADSQNAAVEGKSGAFTTNDVTSSVNARVADGAEVIAGTMDITAENAVKQMEGAGASAGGGGVVTGSAAHSVTDVTVDTNVVVGSGARLLNMGLLGIPWLDESMLRIRVANDVDVRDEALLKTGGVTSRPEARTDVAADVTGLITIGDDAELFSIGDLLMGAYGRIGAVAVAFVKTYGAIGQAGGHSESVVEAEHNINAGQNVLMTAYGDIRLTAGESGDGARFNSIKADAWTETYNYTAAPLDTTSYANAKTDSRTGVTVGAGSEIKSVRNVTLAGYDGSVAAYAVGTGHNPYLDAVGTTTEDGHVETSSSSTVIMDGVVEAGIHHKQSVSIAEDGTITLGEMTPDGVAQVRTINPYEEINAEIERLKKALESAETDEEKEDIQAQIDVLEMLRDSEANGERDVVEIGNLFAAAGDIIVHADTFGGSGRLTARGGPTIEILNESSRYLVLNRLVIPNDDSTGSVRFTGFGSRSDASGWTIREIDKDKRAKIEISNTYRAGGTAVGPGIFLYDEISNLRGLVRIFNASGNLAQFSTLTAAQIQLDVPNGSYIVNHTGDDPWALGGDPFEQWDDAGWGKSISAWVAVRKAATARWNAYSRFDSDEAFTKYLRDPWGKMYPDGQDHANPDGETHVVFDLPNCWEGSQAGSCRTDPNAQYVELFKGFYMKVVQRSTLRHTSKKTKDVQDGSMVVGGQIGVKAKYINLNGKLVSGKPVSWSVELTEAAEQWLNEQKANYAGGGKTLIKIPQKAGGNQLWSSDGGNAPQLYYDVVNDRVVVEEVNASGGGFVYLHGQIMNTNSIGNIEVNSGLGNVTIENRTARELVVSGIDTGRGAVAEVKIVDTGKTNALGGHLTTWYVYELGKGLSVYTNDNGATDYADGVLVNHWSDKSEAEYKPTEGLRLVRTAKRKFKRHWDPHNLKCGPESEAAWYRVCQPGNWQWDGGWYDESVEVEIDEDIKDYTMVEEWDGDFTQWEKKRIDYVDAENKGVPEGPWYYNIYYKGYIELKNSIKADNPVKVKFVGGDTARLEISSTGNIVLTGTINNVFGETKLATEGTITQSADAAIYTNNLLVEAHNSVGTSEQPIRVAASADELDLRGGSLFGDVFFDVVSGSVKINSKNGAGSGATGVSDFVLTAEGDIAGSIIAGNITLRSRYGSIGSSAAPLNLQARAYVLDTGEVVGGTVDAVADGDIHLEQSQGDLRLVQAVSAHGDVHIIVPEGDLINAARWQSVDKEREARLAEVWDKLKLLTGGREEAEQTTVAAYERSIRHAYEQYWALLQRGTVHDGKLVLNDPHDASEPNPIDLYRAQAAAELGIEDPAHVTDEQVQSYANELYQYYRGFFAQELGQDWTERPEFQQFDQNFTFTASDEKVAELTYGAEWTAGQLTYQINQNALLPESDTQTVEQDPNVAGRDVILDVAGAIGSLADSLVIELPTDPDDGLSLTDEQKAALAAASMPGDVVVQYERGVPVRLVVRRIQPLHVDAVGEVTIKASGNAYVRADNDLILNDVDVGGDIRLIADGDIVAAPSGNPVIKGGGGIALEASQGSIGTESAPLVLSFPGILETARAGQDMFLAKREGTFAFGRLYAGGRIVLTADEGDIVGLMEGLSVKAESVHFEAASDVRGQNLNRPLEIELGSVGQLTAVVGGLLFLASTDVPLTLGKLTVGATLRLQGQDITFTDAVAVGAPGGGTGTVEITAGGSVVQSGDAARIVTGSLTVYSQKGQQLLNGNEVGSFTAVNEGTGAIEFRNTRDELTLGRVYQEGLGDVVLHTAGRLTVTDEIRTAGRVDLTALGRIEQTGEGKVLADALKLSSVGGQVLTGANSVREFASENEGGGAIEFENRYGGLVTVAYVRQHNGGDITVSNYDGDLALTGDVTTANDVTVRNSLGSLLVAGDMSARGNIDIETGGDVTISRTIADATGVRLAAGGAVTQTDQGRFDSIDFLNVSSVGGQTLTGENTVREFVSENEGGNAIEFNNYYSGTVTLRNVHQRDGGEIAVSNFGGDMIVDGAVATNDNVLVRNDAGSLDIRGVISAHVRAEIESGGEITVSGILKDSSYAVLDADGAVLQAGAGRFESLGILEVRSAGGQTLTGDNSVRGFTSKNRDGGDIRFNNTSTYLTLFDVEQTNGGAVVVHNVGNMIVEDDVTTTGVISVENDGDLVVKGNIAAEDDVTIVVSGDTTLSGELTTGTAMAVSTGGAMTIFGDVVADHRIDVTAGGAVDLKGTMRAVDAMDISVGGAFTVSGSLEGAGSVNLTAGGAVTQKDDGRFVSIGTMTLSSVGGQLLLGDNNVAALETDNRGGGAVKFNNAYDGLTLRGVRQHDGGGIEVTNDGALSISGETWTTSDDIIITNDGDVVMSEVVRTTGQVTVDAKGSLTQIGDGRIEDAAKVTALTVGGQLLTGDNTVHVIVARNDGGDIKVNNARQLLTLTEVRQLGDGHVHIVNDGAVGVHTVELPYGTLTIEATGSIVNGHEPNVDPSAVNITASDVVLVAGRGGIGAADRFITMDTTGSFGGTVTAESADGVFLEAVRGDLPIRSVRTGGDIVLTADGSIWNRGSDPTGSDAILTGRNVVLTTRNGETGTRQERIVIDPTGIVNAESFGSLFLHILRDLQSDYIRSLTGWVNILVPQGEMQFWQLDARSGVSLTGGGDITIEDVDTAEFEALLTKPGRTLTVRNVTLSKGMTVRGDNVSVHNLLHDGPEPLRVTITGLERLADNVHVQARSEVGVVFERLDLDWGEIAVDTDDLRFRDVLVGSRAVFESKRHRVVADNVNRKLFESHLQIYPRSDRFYLIMAADREILTNAHAVNYDPDYIINEFSTENSFVRATLKYAQVVLVGMREEPAVSMLPPAPGLSALRDGVLPLKGANDARPLVVRGTPVNTDGSLRQGDGVDESGHGSDREETNADGGAYDFEQDDVLGSQVAVGR